MKYDLLVYNAKIHTLKDDTSYSNMLVKDREVALLVKEKYLKDDINLSEDISTFFNGRGQTIIPAFYVFEEDFGKMIMSIMEYFFPKKEEKKDIVYVSRETARAMIQNGIVMVRPIDSVMDKDEKFAYNCFNKFYFGEILKPFIKEEQRSEKKYDKEQIKRILNPIYNISKTKGKIDIKNRLLKEMDKKDSMQNIGSLDIGSKANFLTLNKDIFNIDMDEIDKLQITSSFLEGRELTLEKGSILQNI